MLRELEQIDIMIRARYPIVYVISTEELRVINLIKDITEIKPKKYSNTEIFVWSHARGFRSIKNYEKEGTNQDPLSALKFIENVKNRGIYILLDFHFYMEQPIIIRELRELATLLKTEKKNIIIISPSLSITPELAKDINVIDFPLPNQEEIKKVFDRISRKDYFYNGKKLDLNVSKKKKAQIIKALIGLTKKEIENVLYKSIVEMHSFSIDVFVKEKEQIIRKTGILEYFHSEEDLENIGGLDNLKNWIIKRKYAFSDEARKFGLPYPKGLLLFGVQGCGKSLCCKVIANIWQYPLLRLDVGAIFEGIVGSSESNIRQTIKLAESIAPCILWLDEIEKGFSGIKSSNFSDAGTTARVFGTFLTWMQEKEAPVFVVATSNDIMALPPELLRKGRFDEIFFIDLPTDDERKEIFEIHIQKRNRNPANYDIQKLVKLSKKFSGAEIETTIISALYDAFDENMTNNEKNDLKTRHIVENIKKIIPLATTSKEKINNLRIEAKKRARMANKSSEITLKERNLVI